MKRVIGYFAREKVLTISLMLAAASMFAVAPDAGYAGYVDWDVILLLFSLMAVVEGLKGCGVFDMASRTLARRAGNVRKLTLLLTLACFFASMVVTNDVALITFVPLTAGMLASAPPTALIYAVTLETVAANLGSMATPIGNPQNIYIFSHYSMEMGAFARTILPLAGASLVLLIIFCLPVKKGAIAAPEVKNVNISAGRLIMYLALLAACLLAVFRVLPKHAPCALVVVCLAARDRHALLRVDYALLFTFICFFVFVGNISRIGAVNGFLSRVIAGRETEAGILISQVISNVPAALMLSGFTSDAAALMRGVNIGGLGTLVASLASLISFKAYMKAPGAKSGKYLACFTAVNAVFLAALYALARLGL